MTRNGRGGLFAAIVLVLYAIATGNAHAGHQKRAEGDHPPAPPVLGPMSIASQPEFSATPICAGSKMTRNSPTMYEGKTDEGARYNAAWCQMTDGGWAAWYRVRPLVDPEPSAAPIIWLTDTSPRAPQAPVVDLAFLVVPGSTADKSRAAYGVVKSTTGNTLGKANGLRAAGNVACACDMLVVTIGSAAYCPFAPTPSVDSVAYCKAVSSKLQVTAAMPTMQMLNLRRDPMMGDQTPDPHRHAASQPLPSAAQSKGDQEAISKTLKKKP